MKVARVIGVLFILFVFIGGCATVNIQATPKRVYYEAQVAYFNAWDSYHKVWSALPDTDPRKAEWAQKYHPYFLDAAILIQAWGQTPNDYNEATLANLAIDKLEDVLIQLAIQKGGK